MNAHLFTLVTAALIKTGLFMPDTPSPMELAQLATTQQIMANRGLNHPVKDPNKTEFADSPMGASAVPSVAGHIAIKASATVQRIHYDRTVWWYIEVRQSGVIWKHNYIDTLTFIPTGKEAEIFFQRQLPVVLEPGMYTVFVMVAKQEAVMTVEEDGTASDKGAYAAMTIIATAR
jgi:hypothetical protein